MAYHYKLEKYSGKKSRYTCPNCHMEHVFTRYICIETGKYVSDIVGICDRKSKCNYHYTPKQFFQDFPWEKEGEYREKMAPARRIEVQKPAARIPHYIPFDFVCARFSPNNEFFDWLCSVIADLNRLDQVYLMYRIGTTNEKHPAVIFWQIDEDMKVRDGKLLWYRNGHREKFMTWISARLKKAGMFPEDYQTDKCFFGQHLLGIDRERIVCLVESEKSAIVGACLYPDYIWIASGGCGGLSDSKLKSLWGRKVIVLPDSGEADRWTKQLKDQPFNWKMIPIDNYEKNADVCDIIIDGIRPESGDPVDFGQALTGMETLLNKQ